MELASAHSAPSLPTPAETTPVFAPLLIERFASVRRYTRELLQALSAEDLSAQSMADASPGKWHLAHTTWFFEAMVLCPLAGQKPFRDDWHYLFNSYYDALGERHPRPLRGLLTRPSLAEVLDWRSEVDARVAVVLAESPEPAIRKMVELGLHHEQQHQELAVTDIKHLLFQNPLAPAWRNGWHANSAGTGSPMQWAELREPGLFEIGHSGEGFGFDNEGPRHQVWLRPFALASRPVSVREYLQFIEDGGYGEPSVWLSDGWHARCEGDWQAPLYWRQEEGKWACFTSAGIRALDPDEPVMHLSHYEADAYARWAGARLPLEAEWEVMIATAGGELHAEPASAAERRLHPAPMHAARIGAGHVWEWTASAYTGYPGYRPPPGAVGEYNGKFMSGQMVLRGGSCASSPGHVRTTYRNFFPPGARWQFSGLRLAKDL
jgi:ergothioneine biosynthesis protein EgtB